MTMTVSAKAIAAAIGATMVMGVGQASAATFLLKDTGTGKTDVLNTTGELTGGDSAVAASLKGVSFVDMAAFQIKPDELLVSYNLTNQSTVGTPATKTAKATTGIAELSGGFAEIYKVVGKTDIALPATLINLPVHPGAPFTVFSDTVDLGPGNYLVKVSSSGLDIAGDLQGRAKYAVELQGTAVPEPATWAAMLVGFGAIGGAMRTTRGRRAVAAA